MKFGYRRHGLDDVDSVELKPETEALIALSETRAACVYCKFYSERNTGKKYDFYREYYWCEIQGKEVTSWSVCEKFEL